MNSNESLDSMAKRYKDEMMKLYHASNAEAKNTKTVSSPDNKESSRKITSAECRFMSAEEIINGTAADYPQTIPSYGDDVTEEMINTKSDSLAGSGSVNYDNQSRNSSGENIYVPNNINEITSDISSNESTPAITGIMINTAASGDTNNTETTSNVYSELLPSFEFPDDLAEDASLPKNILPQFVILGSWSNLTGDNSWGLLQFEVTTGSQGNPVQEATVVVSRVVGEKRILTRILTTNYSGLTKSIFLPAPKYSCSSTSGCVTKPFAQYRASVYANGYYPVTNIPVTIEAGVKSLQPVDMIPLPNTGTLPGIQPRGNTTSD